MKKIFALILVAVLASTFAFAANPPYNPTTAPITEHVYVNVIEPLTTTMQASNLDLPVVVAGTFREFTENNQVKFTLKGTAGKQVHLAFTGPTLDPLKSGVAIDGDWSVANNSLVTLTTTGTEVTYTCEKVIADPGKHGAFIFNLSLSTYYTGL